MVTYFVVQGFQRGRRGAFIADQPREARDEMHAKRMAQRLASACDGVIAFSRSGDPTTGDFEDAVIIAKIGEPPDEAMELAA